MCIRDRLRDIVLLYSVLRAFSDKVADTDYLDILEHIGDIFKIYAGNSAYSGIYLETVSYTHLGDGIVLAVECDGKSSAR